MRKGAIITALVLVLVGLALFAGALVIGKNILPWRHVKSTYPVVDAFKSIQIKSNETDIRFLPSTDGTCSVVCSMTERGGHRESADMQTRENAKDTSESRFHVLVSVRDQTLSIETVDNRTWLDRLFMFGDQSITVYLPSGSYADLSVECHTGDVDLPKDYAFESIKISASTGNIACSASASGPLFIQTSTGDVLLSDTAAQSLSLTVSTASVKIRNATVKEDVRITVTTGNTEIDRLTCNALTTSGSTGRIVLKDTTAADSIRIKRSTGDVRFENSDAAEITVETGTGDVTGTLCSPKSFAVKTSTGKTRVPQTAGGKCEITTHTGDIVIELAQEKQP